MTAQVADLTRAGRHPVHAAEAALPAQSGGFTAAWQAHDPLSGVASYDIQTRRLTAASAGTWTDALVAQPDTSLALTAPAGTTTCLRGRATDAAGNRAAWSQPGLHGGALGGRRAGPLAGAGRRRATARCARAAPARRCSGVG